MNAGASGCKGASDARMSRATLRNAVRHIDREHGGPTLARSDVSECTKCWYLYMLLVGCSVFQGSKKFRELQERLRNEVFSKNKVPYIVQHINSITAGCCDDASPTREALRA